MLNLTTFYIIFGFLFLTVLLNLLLIVLVFRMRKLPKDLVYIVILAISDCVPFLSTLIIIIGRASNKQFGLQDSIQQILGFINISWVVISSQCAACLAKYRLDIINNRKPTNYLFICSTISSLIILSFFIIAGSRNEYISYNGAVSVLYPQTSIISAYSFYHGTIHILVNNLIIIISYSMLVYKTSQTAYDLRLDNSPTKDISMPLKKKVNKVFLKGFAFVLVSALILIPSTILNLAEAYLIPNESPDSKLSVILPGIKTILIVSSCVINSLLVLFFHTGLNTELKNLFCIRKKRGSF